MHALQDIKKLRRKYHLTQEALAKAAGVSQSLIAKTEAGILEPTYTKANRIFEVLDAQRDIQEPKAKGLMRKNIITLQSNATIPQAIKLMRAKSISQIPVLEEKQVIGLLTESSILRALTKKPHANLVHEIMEEAPPIIPQLTTRKTIIELLQNHPIVLVQSKGALKGLIAKTDVLGGLE